MEIRTSLLAWYEKQTQNPEAVVLDIDGVLILQSRALPGARAFVERLRRDGVPFSLLTNAADESVDERLEVLTGAGFEIDPERITSSGHPLRSLVNREHLRGKLFFMMAKLGDPCYAEAAELEITTKIEDLQRCSGVLIGEGPTDWREEINAIINFLRKKPNAPLICPNPDPYFPDGAGAIKIGAGGITGFIVQILASAGVELQPVFLGKPYAPIYEHNHHRMEQAEGRTIDRGKAIMIGDMLEGDILGGNNFGYKTALLLSGGTRRAMIGKSTTRPDLIFEGL